MRPRLRPVAEPTVDPVPDFFAVMRRWDEWMVGRGLAEKTRGMYRYMLLDMAADLMMDPLEVTEAELFAHIASLPPRGNKAAAVARASRSFYGFTFGHGFTPTNPAVDLAVKEHRAGRVPRLSEQDLRAILRAAFRKSPRRGWAILLAYTTGARAGSLVAVEPADVHLEAGYIEFKVAKNDKPYTVPLERKGRIAALHLLALSGGRAVAAPPLEDPSACADCGERSPYVRGMCQRCYTYWCRTGRQRPRDAVRHNHTPAPTLLGIHNPTTFREWVHEAGEAAGVHAWPHLLRHCFATRLAEDPETDLRSWIELMNHSDGSQFRRYASASPQRLRSAVGRL